MNRDPLGNIIVRSLVVLILSAVFIELVDGFLSAKFHFSYVSTLVRLSYLVLPLFLIIYVPVNRGLTFLFFISLLLLLMFLRLLRPETRLDAVIFDFQYTARSALLLVSIFLFGYVLQADDMNKLFRRYFPIQWGVITLAVLAHIVLGFGGMTYTSGDQMREGYTSFFASSNQIVFLYAASWWVLVSMITRKLPVRMFLTVFTLAIMLAMGTRSGVVLVCMMTGLFVYKKIYDKSKRLLAVALVLSLVTGVFLMVNFSYVMGLIAGVFIKLSSEASHLTQNVTTYGALTALVSKRDILLANALDGMSHYDLREMLIGPNFLNYKKIVGSYQDTLEIRMAEMDPVDLMGGFGIIGVLLVYLPILWLFFRLLRKHRGQGRQRDNKIFYATEGGILISIVGSSMSGHVFLSPLSVLTVGLILAAAWHASKANDGRCEGTSAGSGSE